MIAYLDAPDISERIKNIIFKLQLDHVKVDRIACFRSKGSGAKNTIARCHALPKIMQKALNCQPFYIIEVISEEFDKMPYEEQTKTLIHEILHVPVAFGGGFKHHDYVNEAMVDKFFKQYNNLNDVEKQETLFKDKIKEIFKK